MTLQHGPAAIEALRAMVRDPAVLCAVEVDPEARRGARLSVLALADTTRTLLIDVSATPTLATAWPSDHALCAYDAKVVHRALLRAGAGGPSRWACVRTTEILLAGGRAIDLDLEATATRYGMPSPPDGSAGLSDLAARAQAIAHLVDKQIPLLRTSAMVHVSRIEAAAVAPIAEMEHHGVPFDEQAWRTLDEQAQSERDVLAGELRVMLRPGTGSNLFGKDELNLESDAELRSALQALGHALPNLRRDTVARLPTPLGPMLARFRELCKLVSTYGESFLEHVATDGRIHPTFEAIGASTGRMACHAPNLQAVPKDGPHRACFRADEGRALVTADYATCELRILAEMSGDPVFAQAFARGEDLHARVAREMFGKPVSKTENAELRQRAKAINFGLAYGMGAGGLARTLDSSVDQARTLLREYFRRFPKIGAFLEDSAREALARGYATTLAGRRLYFDDLDTSEARSQAERIAKNMPIQGTNADITKIALARLRRRLATFERAFTVHAVHDELVVECQESQSQEVAAAVADEMRAAGAELLRRIPLGVEVHVGRTWG
ncbi:MAG: DNA polymerase [Myxococcota bacterium]